MELKDLLIEYGLVGVISTYKFTLDEDQKVEDLNIKNIDKALKMVNLKEEVKDKYLKDLSLDELFKIDLINKLDKEIIIVGNLSNCLNYKDRDFIKKLLLKLVNNYHKKIIVIDNDVKVFFNLVKVVVVVNGKDILYETKDFYDDNLYKYTSRPKIIELVKYLNKEGRNIQKTTDIYELIKDIYRRVSWNI